VICVHCGNKVAPPYKRTGTPKFCNRACCHAYRTKMKGQDQKHARATCHPDRPLSGLGLCSTCYSQHHRKTHESKYRLAARRHSLMKHYGMSIEEYDILATQQDYKCAICEEIAPALRALVVDHNHETGRVRELLCRACNSGIGALGDSIERLEKALAYLRKHAQKVVS
jgi:hypothetical protein